MEHAKLEHNCCIYLTGIRSNYRELELFLLGNLIKWIKNMIYKWKLLLPLTTQLLVLEQKPECVTPQARDSVPAFLFLLIWQRSSAIQEYLNCTRFCQLQVFDGFLVCKGWKVAGGLHTQHCVTRAGDENTKTLFSVINPLYSNSTAFLSRIPKPPLLCGVFFFFKERKKGDGKKERNGWPPLSQKFILINYYSRLIKA